MISGHALAPLLMLWAGLSSANKGKNELLSLLSKAAKLTRFSRKSSIQMVEENIAQKRQEVDTALALISVKIHHDLLVNALGSGYVLAHREVLNKVQSAPDWPLPHSVLDRLEYTREDVMQANSLEDS